MVILGREIVRLIIEDNGPEEILRRISDPYWFQSLGCVLGFDRHSSGVTTTVCGAIKEGIRGREKEWVSSLPAANSSSPESSAYTGAVATPQGDNLLIVLSPNPPA